ncbi:hypothetical protein TSUD_172150 [Trifolium subterraneum]|uniref:Uncharacterized protein n=1 Tax=Trifolium subterraneum TaxID=3900 RepID=A0A2Z6MNX2_TRISU|nr:hypothetical protein TSUD_172150 [Trifolium subterraneum]
MKPVVPLSLGIIFLMLSGGVYKRKAALRSDLSLLRSRIDGNTPSVGSKGRRKRQEYTLKGSSWLTSWACTSAF